MLDKPNDNGSPPADLDHFVLGAHEKNPQDLPRNVMLAAIITFVTMGLLSAGPYFYNLAAARAERTEKATAAEPAPKAADPAKKEAATDVTKTNPDPLAES